MTLLTAVLSAIIVATHMISEFCLKLKFKKNIILLTNGNLLSDFADSDAISSKIQQQGITLFVLYVYIGAS